MSRYIARSLVGILPVLVLVSIITFVIIHLLPGDAALAILGEEQAKNEALYQTLRAELGLDKPLPIQYLNWASNAITGDFGNSTRNQQPVFEAIRQRLMPTVQLALLSLLLSSLIAIPTGIISAIRPNSKTDTFSTVFALSGVAIPDFWFGLMLMLVLALRLKWLPVSGYVSPFEDLGESLRHMVMPTLTLGTGLAATMTRQVRSALIEVLQQEYITTARSKGLQEATVIRRHALTNALIPVVTVIGMQTGRLFGGAVVVETIYAIPGMGRLVVDSIFFRDFQVLQGVVLIMAGMVLLTNLITDIFYAYLDPRIRYT